MYCQNCKHEYFSKFCPDCGAKLIESKEFDAEFESSPSKELIERLQRNPIFQLSLSSKELFHSNFLYWLSLIEDKKCEFRNLIEKLSNRKIDWPEMIVARREESNLDLCIRSVKNQTEEKEGKDNKTVEEDYVFVLENKFKSIISKKQLDDYHKKVEAVNKKQSGRIQCAYCLLTLAKEEECVELDSIQDENTWNIITYSKYAQFIHDIYLGNTIYKDPSIRVIIEYYYDYIKTVSNDNFFCLPSIEGDTWDKMSNNSTLEKLRIDDIRQKICFNRFAIKVKDLLPEKEKEALEVNLSDDEIWSTNKEGHIYLNTGFIDNRGLIMISYFINENVMLRFEIQGDTFKKGIIFKKTAEDGKSNSKVQEGEDFSWLKDSRWKSLPNKVKRQFNLPKRNKKTADDLTVLNPWVKKKKFFGTYDMKNLMKYQSRQIKIDSKISQVADEFVNSLLAVKEKI